MPQPPEWEKFKIDTPATYRIRVQGIIDPVWSDLLGGMSITTDSTADNDQVTTLVGHLADQAALSGVLKALYDLHIPLLSVKKLDEKRKRHSA